MQDELATTKRSYEDQLSMMSDHLCSMNETLSKQREEIDTLKLGSKVQHHEFCCRLLSVLTKMDDTNGVKDQAAVNCGIVKLLGGHRWGCGYCCQILMRKAPAGAI